MQSAILTMIEQTALKTTKQPTISLWCTEMMPTVTATKQPDFYVAYAYSPREKHTANGGIHIVTEHDIKLGRLIRRAHSALCQPPSKRFWGLHPFDNQKPTCKKCLELAKRYGIKMLDESEAE